MNKSLPFYRYFRSPMGLTFFSSSTDKKSEHIQAFDIE